MVLIEWLKEFVELEYEHFQTLMEAQRTFPSTTPLALRVTSGLP